MVPLRHLLLALAERIVQRLLLLKSWALGLGEVQVQSALSQPLRAQIALREVAGLHQDEVVVRSSVGSGLSTGRTATRGFS